MSRIGVLLASLLSALALAAVAGATSAPPRFGIQPLFRSLPIILLPGQKRGQVSCSAHSPQRRTAVGRFERKLSPVACEQPPRSRVRDAGSSIVLAAP
jgi:hypothetical protein